MTNSTMSLRYHGPQTTDQFHATMSSFVTMQKASTRPQPIQTPFMFTYSYTVTSSVRDLHFNWISLVCSQQHQRVKNFND